MLPMTIDDHESCGLMVYLQDVEFGLGELLEAGRGAATVHLIERLERHGEVGEWSRLLLAPHHLAPEVEPPEVAQVAVRGLMVVGEAAKAHLLAVGFEVVVGLANVLIDVFGERTDIFFVRSKLAERYMKAGALDGVGAYLLHDVGESRHAGHVGQAKRHAIAGGEQVVGDGFHLGFVALVGVGAGHVDHASDPARGDARLVGGSGDDQPDDGKGMAVEQGEVKLHGGGAGREAAHHLVVDECVPHVSLIKGVVDIVLRLLLGRLVELVPQ